MAQLRGIGGVVKVPKYLTINHFLVASTVTGDKNVRVNSLVTFKLLRLTLPMSRSCTHLDSLSKFGFRA